MRTSWKAFVVGAAVLLTAGQAPDADHMAFKARVDTLLDAVRAGDEARFATLVGRIFPDQPPSDPDEGPLLGDYAAEPPYYGPLTLASLRRFATACSYSGPDARMPVQPLSFSGLYSCGGEPGHSLGVHFSADGRLAVWITIMSPRMQAEADARGLQMQAEDAVAMAEQARDVTRIAGRVDALFVAALAGDRTRFDALVGRGFEGRGATLSDERHGEPVAGPLTMEALRPIAAACRRALDEPPYQSFDMAEEINQEAAYICDGEPGYVLHAGFEQGGARIGWLRMEGRIRRPMP